MGKGEIARYEQFLLFPLCFLKACFVGVSKGVIVWEWVKSSKRTISNKIGKFYRKKNYIKQGKITKEKIVIEQKLFNIVYIIFYFTIITSKVSSTKMNRSHEREIDYLTHYHTMPHFDTLKIYSCGKHFEKRRNCLQQAIFFFLAMFCTPYYSYSFFHLNALLNVVCSLFQFGPV